MTRTEDGGFVESSEPVYEILYRYYNAEYSEPEPHLTISGNIPEGYKRWKYLINCRKACERIIEKRKEVWENTNIWEIGLPPANTGELHAAQSDDPMESV